MLNDEKGIKDTLRKMENIKKGINDMIENHEVKKNEHHVKRPRKINNKIIIIFDSQRIRGVLFFFLYLRAFYRSFEKCLKIVFKDLF